MKKLLPIAYVRNGFDCGAFAYELRSGRRRNGVEVKDIRRRILGRKLAEEKLRRVTVSEALLQISDNTLAWALRELGDAA